MAQPAPPPRLGDFSEVFRVLRTDSPRPHDGQTSPVPERATASPVRLSKTQPSPRISSPKTTTERPASRRAVVATAAATHPPPTDRVGFLSGIERFLSPLPPSDEDSTSAATASETDEASSSSSSSSDDAGSDQATTRRTRRTASPAVAIVSASTSPATAAVAIAAPAPPATPQKRASLIPKTAARRLIRTASPPRPPPSPPTRATVPPPLAGNVIVPLRPLSRAAKLARIDALLAAERARAHAHHPAATPETPAVHVFVDLSNIAIGFINRLRAERGVPPERRVQEPPLFFGGLARILERGRCVERRVTAGSVRTALLAPGLYDFDNDDDDDYNDAHRAWHAYMVEAERLGYEMNLLRRVPASPFKATTSSLANAEQAVDEVLQLKMCHSVLDAAPGTLVLATGDGAAAEFSDGFLRHVQRALARDWCVELVAWRQGIAAAWRALARTHRGRFRIVELDAFVHELHGVFEE